jgi:hypothetical protein
MNGTDFNRACESPTVVTLWAGALCARRKLSFMPHCWLTLVVGLFLVGSMGGVERLEKLN